MKNINALIILFYFLLTVLACKQPNSNALSNKDKDTNLSGIQNLDFMKTDPMYAQARGVSKFEKGDIEGAIDEFTIYIDHNNFALDITYYMRGVAKLSLKRNWSSLYDLTKAIGINPKIGEYYTARAQAKISLGFTNWCCEDLLTAKKLGDVNAEKLIMQYCNKDK